MSAPRRWKDAPDAPLGMRELLSVGQTPRALDDLARARGARRLAQGLASPGGAAHARAGARGRARPMAWAAGLVVTSLGAKLAAAAAVTVVTVGLALGLRGAREPVRPSPATVMAPVPATRADHDGRSPAAERAADESLATNAVETASAPAPAPVGQAIGARRAAPRPAARMDPAAESRAAEPVPSSAVSAARARDTRDKGTLVAELALLEDARAVLARDPEVALARLAQHRALWPAGRLAAERDLLELDALRRAGRTADARALAEAWLARDPTSMHAARVRAILTSLGP